MIVYRPVIGRSISISSLRRYRDLSFADFRGSESAIFFPFFGVASTRLKRGTD